MEPTIFRPDPLIQRLKDRHRRAGLGTSASHLGSVVVVLAGSVLLVVGSLRPWVDLYAIGNPTLLGSDADAAVAATLVGVAMLQAAMCASVLWAARHRGRQPRFLHLLSIPLAVVGFLFYTVRVQGDTFRVHEANLDQNVPPSGLGDGLYITGVGLALGLLAGLVALPAARRVWRT